MDDADDGDLEQCFCFTHFYPTLFTFFNGTSQTLFKSVRKETFFLGGTLNILAKSVQKKVCQIKKGQKDHFL